jgi:hypothetical protein
MKIGINYVYRTQQDMINDFDSGTNGDPVAEDGQVTWSNELGTWSKFSGVSLTLTKAFGPSGFQFLTSYTYTIDNEGYASGTGSAFGSQTSDYCDSIVACVNRYGTLDTPHQFKFNGSWSHTWGRFGLTTGLSAWYYSGKVWADIQRVGTAVGTQTEYLEPAGSKEIGNEYRADLHVEGNFTIKGSIAVGAYVDVLNLGNQQMATRVQTNVNSSSYGEANLWQTARRYQVGFKFEF